MNNTAVWHLKTGELVPISTLTDEHLHNVRYYLAGKIVEKHQKLDAIKIALENTSITQEEADKMVHMIEGDISRHESEIETVREEYKRRHL